MIRHYGLLGQAIDSIDRGDSQLYSMEKYAHGGASVFTNFFARYCDKLLPNTI